MTTSVTNINKQLMRKEEPEWIVWLVVIVLLVGGVFLRNSVENKTKTLKVNGVSINYPNEWVQTTDNTGAVQIEDPFSSVQAPTKITVQQISQTEVGLNLTSLSNMAMAWSTKQGLSLQSYRSLMVKETTVSGQKAVMVEYAYIPKTSGGKTAGVIPEVVRAKDFLLTQGDSLLIITFSASATIFEDENNTWQKILKTLKIE